MDDEQTLYEKVRRALCGFFESDRDLLEKGANERSITHKLAEHLQCQFRHLNVDCEYNRHGLNAKILSRFAECIGEDDSRDRMVYPDIIVHRRGEDKSNLLVIEAKKTTMEDMGSKSMKRGLKRDRCKLREFTRLRGCYEYKFGLLLVFDVGEGGKKICRVECFKDGDEHNNPVWGCLRGFRGGG